MWPFSKKEWVTCAQFDRIAQEVGVGFAGQKHYRFRSRYGKKAGSNFRKRQIDFDKKWFLSLSEIARCSVLVHELWHSVNWPMAWRWRKRHAAMVFLGVPALSVVIASALAPRSFSDSGVSFSLEFWVSGLHSLARPTPCAAGSFHEALLLAYRVRV